MYEPGTTFALHVPSAPAVAVATGTLDHASAGHNLIEAPAAKVPSGASLTVPATVEAISLKGF
jgi:hypothetical protein